MDFTFGEFPSTVNFNTFQAYFDLNKCKLPNIRDGIKTITKQIKSLRHLVLDSLLENWCDNPIFKEIERQEDRNYILSNLNVNLPLKILSSHIQEDFFWRKSYQHRWKTLYYQQYTYQPQPLHLAETQEHHEQQQKTSSEKIKTTIWINIYMERHLQEFIENVTTTEYEQESVQATLDICAMYINQLEINCLQPSMDGRNDHIPLDYILQYLPELHTLRLTYCTKTIGTQFYLGCNMLSRRDASLLARGLKQCHELLHFCLHNTKLEPYQLGLFAHSLDKGCHYLSTLSLEHCSLGDEGIRHFLNSCNKESFGTLKYLDLTNNKITSEGAYVLSKVFKSLALQKLCLRLNPIGSEGATSIFAALDNLPIINLDISGCSLDETITKMFMKLVVQNKTLWFIDASNNSLGCEFGKHLLKVIGFNKTLKNMDLKYTGLSLDLCKKFQEILKASSLKKNIKSNFEL